MAEQPVSELFAAVAEWMMARGHGHEQAVDGVLACDGPDGIGITLNITDKAIGALPPYSIKLMRLGWPLCVMDPYGGAVLGMTEGELIAVFKGAPGDGAV